MKLSLSKQFVILMVATLIIASCEKRVANQLVLDEEYSSIDKISSLANCYGPKGAYDTYIVSKKNNEMSFRQTTKENSNAATIKIDTELAGYVFDNTDSVIDTLSKKAVEMIRSHDFHRLHTNPWHFYDSITFSKPISKNSSLFTGKDRLKNEVLIYYNHEERLIERIHLKNPIDTSQLIEILYRDWEITQYGRMNKRLQVVQAKKDTFKI